MNCSVTNPHTQTFIFSSDRKRCLTSTRVQSSKRSSDSCIKWWSTSNRVCGWSVRRFCWLIILIVLLLVSVLTVAIAVSVNDSGTDPLLNRATKRLMRKEWHCYLGRLGFPDPSNPNTPLYSLQSTWQTVVSRDFYQTATLNDQAMHSVQTIVPQGSDAWIEEPTHGLQKYYSGCQDKELLTLEKQSEDGESLWLRLAVTMGFWSTTYTHPYVPNAFLGNLEVLRYESKQFFPNGGIFVLRTTHIPNGKGAWPAFWMIGTIDSYTWQHPTWTGIGAASTWPFQGQGEIDFFEVVDGTFRTDTYSTLDYRHQVLHTPPECMVKMSSPIGTPISASAQSCATGGGGQGDQWGCSIPIQMSVPGSNTSGDWLTNDMTYIFEYSAKAKRVRTYSFESVKLKKHTELLRTLMSSQDQINDATNLLLVSLSGSRNGEHQLLGETCDGVFKDMHLVWNTAICGDWAGGVNASMRSQCEKTVTDAFISELTSPPSSTPRLQFWNTTSPLSLQYSWNVSSLHINAYK